jgi:hypothetical protein
MNSRSVLRQDWEYKMSTRIASARGRFRPESVRDFSQRSRRLSRWLGLRYQRAQELLARIYGYSDFHELRRELERPGTPGPFDDSDPTVSTAAERGRESRIAHLIAELKGVNEFHLTAHERAVASMGLFRQAAQHRLMFNAVTKPHGSATAGANSRRLIPAPPPSHPALAAIIVDVECAADEDVEWLWTETAAGRYVSGYRLISSTRGALSTMSSTDKT